jgi:hypothetical protein
MPQEHISLIGDSPFIRRTLQKQLKRVKICRVLHRCNHNLNQAWAKLAVYIKLAPTLQPFLFEILTWGLLYLVDIDQT